MTRPLAPLTLSLVLSSIACHAEGVPRGLSREVPAPELQREDEGEQPPDPRELPDGSAWPGDPAPGEQEHFLPAPPGVAVEPWVEGLEVPWSLVFADSRHALVSERGGAIRLIRDGALSAEPVALLDVHHSGEAGLMGLALHPGYPEAPYLYAMHTYQDASGIANRVVRMRLDSDWRATPQAVVIEGIPGARFHDGGRIGFGPDGMLYVTTGDATDSARSQDPGSLAGKVLRLTPDGGIPDDNPFPSSPVYALGLRNPQGLAWHPHTGSLFVSDHGPSGEMGLQAHDEVNVILSGANYGWPEVVGAPGDERFEDPLIYWPERAVPPGGMAFLGSDLFIATLGSEALMRLRVAREAGGGYRLIAVERWLAHDPSRGVHGRFRDVVVGPDQALYLLTSNRDGRGQVRTGDDHIWRLSPQR